MIGGQLTSATSSIVNLKANLSHVTKCTQLTWNVWRTCCPHNTRAWNPIPQHTMTSLRPSKSASLHRPTPRTRLWLIPPSEGATAHRADFSSTVFPEGPGPDSTDVADDVVDFEGTVSPPRAPHWSVNNNTTQANSRRCMDPVRVLPEDSTFTLPSGHFGSGLGGPTVNIVSPRRDEQGANAHAAHMAGPAGAHLRVTPTHTPTHPVTRPPHITPPPYTPLASTADPTVIRPSSPCTGG